MSRSNDLPIWASRLIRWGAVAAAGVAVAAAANVLFARATGFWEWKENADSSHLLSVQHEDRDLPELRAQLSVLYDRACEEQRTRCIAGVVDEASNTSREDLKSRLNACQQQYDRCVQEGR